MVELFGDDQSQVAQANTPIGEVAELSGNVQIVRATGEIVNATVGTEVFPNDTFETGTGGGVGITFNDDSAFSLGADARLTIDQFVYNPVGDSGMAMNLVQGAFSFVSGQIAKSGDGNMTIQTPTATIGVRGTAGAGDEDEAVLLQEPGLPLGEMTVTTLGGTVTLSSVNAYTSTSNPLAPPTVPVFRPLDQIQSLFGGAIRELPAFTPSNGDTDERETPTGGEEDQQGNGDSETTDQQAQSDDDAGAVDDRGDLEAEEQGDLETTLVQPQTLPTPADQSALDTVISTQQSQLEQGGFDNPDDDFFDDLVQAAADATEAGTIEPPPSLDSLTDGEDGETEDPPITVTEPPSDEEDDDDTEDTAPVVSPVTDFTGNASITLTAGVPEVINLAADNITINVTGTAQNGDTFTDTQTGALSQSIVLQSFGSHFLDLTNIDFVEFASTVAIDVQTVKIKGDQAVSLNGAGTFDGSITGDANDNVISLGAQTVFASASFDADLGAGNDHLIVDVTGISRLNNGDFGSGIDTLTIGTTISHRSTVTGLENFNGGAASDIVTVLDSLVNANYDSGGGNGNILTLQGGTSHTATITGFNTIRSEGAGGVQLDLANAVSGTVFNFLQTNGDVLTLSGGNDTFDALGVETINGGLGVDSVLLDSSSAETVTISGIENVTRASGARNDFVQIADADALTINLEAGNDTIAITNAVNTNITIENIETVLGNTGQDVVVNQGSVGAAFALGGGGDQATGTLGALDGFTFLDVTDAAISAGETIFQYEPGIDRLDFTQIATAGTITFNGDAGLLGNGSASASFQGTGSNLLQIDVDGNGTADMEVTIDQVTAGNFVSTDILSTP